MDEWEPGLKAEALDRVFANVRRFLNQGELPPPDAVRVEGTASDRSWAGRWVFASRALLDREDAEAHEGGWRQTDTGEVVLQMLEDIGSEGKRALEREAGRLTEWLAGTRVLPRFPSPLSKAAEGA